MKFSSKFRTKKLGIIYTIFGSFWKFLLIFALGKGRYIFYILPQIRPRKIPERDILEVCIIGLANEI